MFVDYWDLTKVLKRYPYFWGQNQKYWVFKIIMIIR